MSSNTEQLDKIINLAINEILNDFKLGKEDSAGWHQFFKSQKIGNVATAQALLILNEFSAPFPDQTKSFNFLLSNQLKSKLPENNGGWTFISNVSDVANTESTCWVLQALSKKYKVVDKRIKKGLEWLKQNFIETSEFNGWGPTKYSGIRTYSTCLVLNTLYKLGESKRIDFVAALDSLKRAQNSDGGWGDSFKSSSTLIHTGHSLITLINLGTDPSTRLIQIGVKWITRTLQTKVYENGFHMGYSEMFDFVYYTEGQRKSQRITFYHMPLVYAIITLIKCRVDDSKLIYEIIISLLKSNDNGTWQHPFISEKPLWAVYDVLLLFDEFKKSSYITNFNNFKPKNIEKKKYDVIIFTVVPVEFETLNSILEFAPKEKKEDYEIKGFWYYEYELKRPEKRSLSCLITMIGSAGEVGCYLSCSVAFEEFDCDLAILCGIAAGNKDDIKKYSSVIAESIVAYEHQRLEKGKITYRPKIFTVEKSIKRSLEKINLYSPNWNTLVNSYVSKTKIDLKEVKKYNVSDTKLKIGVVASGSKLIADGKTLQKIKKEIPHEKGIIALEMEGSGFAICCNEYDKKWIVVRGISDYGEDDKNDKNNKTNQPIAVATAAASMIYYLQYFHKTYDEN